MARHSRTSPCSPKNKSFIAVMGATGSGKSSLIEAVTGLVGIVGHSLECETIEVQAYEVVIESTTLVLVDTPGFDDTRMSDYEILQKIAEWLQTVTDAQQRLSGLVYLHRITNTRVQGSARRALHAFQRICGEENYRNVVLATTFWNNVENCTAIGEDREQKLLTNEGFWKSMKDNGARTARLTRDYRSIIPDLLAISQKPAVNLEIQRELNEGRSLEDTAAGLFLNENTRALDEEHVLKTKQMQDDFTKQLDAQQHKLEMARKLHSRSMLFREQKQLASIEHKKQNLNRKLEAIRLNQEIKEAELASKLREEQVLETEQMLERERAEMRQKRAAEERRALERYKLSKTQRKKVDQNIDLLRAASVAGLAQIYVPDVNAEGIGMKDAKDSTRPSVRRSGLNVWCDYCLLPFGINEHVFCPTCTMGLCLSCHAQDKSCLDRRHEHTRRSQFYTSVPHCNRFLLYVGTVCSFNDCRRRCEGVYFHCCQCDNDDFDICIDCVMKGRHCHNSQHALLWAVAPSDFSNV